MENERLLTEYAESGSPALLDELVRRNQGLLHFILRQFSSTGEPYEDLLQVANLGLIKAAKRYESERGVRFSTYATAVVDGEIRHHLRDALLMRQPRWFKQLSIALQEARAELSSQLGRSPTEHELSVALNITEEGVHEVLRVSSAIELYGHGDEFDPVQCFDEIDSGLVRSLHLHSFQLPLEDRIVLDQAIEKLSIFHRKLIHLLFYRDLTQAEVARVLDLSPKKVSRESSKALEYLKKLLERKVS